jgi:hypothetical protein
MGELNGELRGWECQEQPFESHQKIPLIFDLYNIFGVDKNYQKK